MLTCRASRNVDLHHIVPRAAGGSHEADNLTLLCGGHHRALHQGNLTITGTAPALEVRWHAEAATHGGRDTRDPDAPACHVPPAPFATHVGRETKLAEQVAAPGSGEHLQLAADAQLALVGLKFPKQVARAAVEVAFAELGPEPRLEHLIRAALRSFAKRA